MSLMFKVYGFRVNEGQPWGSMYPIFGYLGFGTSNCSAGFG